MTAGQFLAAVLQVTLVVVGGPLLLGLMRKVRARCEGRVGPPIHQPLRDLRKLFAKERIAPEHTSWVFAAAPVVLVAGAAVVAIIAPFVSTKSSLDHAGDLFAVAALLLVGTVFLALAGLDPGTAFGGMGASREMTIAALAEPTLVLAIFALSIRAGSSNLGAIVAATLDHPRSVVSVAYLLSLAAFGIATLAETARLPVDNPSTHLELTMVHEAMVLEYSGSDLALIELGAAMRLVVFLGLLAELFVPWGIATSTGTAALLLAAVIFILKVGFLGIILAVFEVFTAKLRLFRVPELLTLSFVLAFLAVASAVVLR
jgi:formate hydrogenlyase subunit 4